jgi:5-enolpyruvylshikimate-3-phosphate synthase
MAGAVAALGAGGASTVRGWASVATSYPGFTRDLDDLRR